MHVFDKGKTLPYRFPFETAYGITIRISILKCIFIVEQILGQIDISRNEKFRSMSRKNRKKVW